jgi:hypothetical protein
MRVRIVVSFCLLLGTALLGQEESDILAVEEEFQSQ